MSSETWEPEAWQRTVASMEALDRIIKDLRRLFILDRRASESIDAAVQLLCEAREGLVFAEGSMDHWEVKGKPGEWAVVCGTQVLGSGIGPFGFRRKREAQKWLREIKTDRGNWCLAAWPSDK